MRPRIELREIDKMKGKFVVFSSVRLLINKLLIGCKVKFFT